MTGQGQCDRHAARKYQDAGHDWKQRRMIGLRVPGISAV
jgi:hypothetical protein